MFGVQGSSNDLSALALGLGSSYDFGKAVVRLMMVEPDDGHTSTSCA